MGQTKNRIVVAGTYSSEAIETLRSAGEVSQPDSYDESSLIQAVHNCDALLVRSSAQVTRAVIEAADRLRVIGRAGVGLDNIDVAAARERGVTVVHTPSAATDAVADLAVGLMLAVVRGVGEGDRALRQNRFREARSTLVGRELSSLTIGIIGMGRIGRAVARRCREGFGTTIIYNDIVAPGLLGFVAESVDKEELYRRADIVSLHVPLTPLTRHLINSQSLSLFKPDAILINTARGDVVDSGALAERLVAGQLGGAGLDVFEEEPLPINHPLLNAPNTVLTPHLGAKTVGGQRRMNAVVDDVLRVLNEQQPMNAL